MKRLRKLSALTISIEDKLHILKTHIGNKLEQPIVVWGSNISKQNEKQIERVQRVAVKRILQKKCAK